jgi:ABC-type methionine transport system ATPase subunit
MKSASSRRSPADEDALGDAFEDMKRPTKKQPPATTTRRAGIEQRRFWLMYPPRLIQEPLLWTLGHKFKVVTNIRQASVTDEIGIVCLELDGKRPEVNAAVQWLEKLGVSVEPVEINVIES